MKVSYWSHIMQNALFHGFPTGICVPGVSGDPQNMRKDHPLSFFPTLSENEFQKADLPLCVTFCGALLG